METRWNSFKSALETIFFAALMLQFCSNGCSALNLEGLALLEFRWSVKDDPNGALINWNPKDSDPCNWSGVNCVDGRVEILNLTKQSLGGKLVPVLGKLAHLRAIILHQNKLSGAIPKEIGQLTTLELLDLRGNNLTGTIPVEIQEIRSLKCFLTCGNKLEGVSSSCTEKSDLLPYVNNDPDLSYSTASAFGCMKDHFDDRFKMKKSSLVDFEKINGAIKEPDSDPTTSTYTSPRRTLFEEASNLAAATITKGTPQEFAPVPATGTGSFPAVPHWEISDPQIPSIPPSSNSNAPPTTIERRNRRWGWWIYALIGGGILLAIAVTLLLLCRKQGVAAIKPWKTGLSGQLQKAFVTGVPKVNRAELVAACEDFSNIISDTSEYTVFKGTLSSGVEIAVVSTKVSVKDWSKHSERYFRKKVDVLSRVNHKNFVNLLGYCDEDEPFMRMMVLEYAPNGTLFEHLHVKEFEHLDWSARIRILMGIAYCLQFLHHEQTPPVVIADLQSASIFITEDSAAKIADISIWKELIVKGKMPNDDYMDHSEVLFADTGSNIYSFGILMLEIISGRMPYSEEQGSIVDWAMEYLKNRNSVGYLVDPTLKSFKNEELDIVCEAILDCIRPEPKKWPTIKDIIAKLREVISITAEAAKPRLSPLWWAELEILSVEAS